MAEDLGDHLGVEDESDDSHWGSASVAVCTTLTIPGRTPRSSAFAAAWSSCTVSQAACNSFPRSSR